MFIWNEKLTNIFVINKQIYSYCVKGASRTKVLYIIYLLLINNNNKKRLGFFKIITKHYY